MMDMSDPFGWFSRGEEERRDLERLRDFREDVLWLARNAPPEAWQGGVEQMQRVTRDANLVYHVQRAMPRQTAAPAEIEEMKALIDEMLDEPESRQDALRHTLENPAWHLRCLRRAVARIGTYRGDI
jgi:hypothetical protein